MTAEERWADVDEAATHLAVNKDSIYRWIDSMGLPAHRLGRYFRFKLSELDKWVRSDGIDGLTRRERFFVPAPDLAPEHETILRNEPLRLRRNMPHIVEEAYRRGGQLVYVCSKFPNGLTQENCCDAIRRAPYLGRLPWRTMMSAPELYVRGEVKHPYHRTIVLEGWCHVLTNTEVTFGFNLLPD